jgi:hypothetical protein
MQFLIQSIYHSCMFLGIFALSRKMREHFSPSDLYNNVGTVTLYDRDYNVIVVGLCKLYACFSGFSVLCCLRMFVIIAKMYANTGTLHEMVGV